MGNDWDVWFINNSGRDVARLRLTSNGSLDWAHFFDYGIRYDLDADGFRWAPSLKCVMCDEIRYPDTWVPRL